MAHRGEIKQFGHKHLAIRNTVELNKVKQDTRKTNVSSDKM